MVAPIDYTINVQSPFEAALGGYKTGLGFRQVALEQRAAEAQLAQQEAMRQDLASLASNPNPTAKDYSSMMVKYPTLSEHFKRGWETYSGEQQQNRINTGTQVYAALNANQPQIAIDLLKEQALAYRDAGDEAQAKAFEDTAKLVELDPASAKTTAGLMLSSLMGPDKFSSTLSQIGAEERARQLQPGEIKKQEAELAQAGLELGLTQAQTAKTIAETKGLQADTRKTLMELEATEQGGITDPQKRFDAEKKLRDEYQKETDDFVATQEAYRRIQSTEPTGAGDVALIVSYMKMIDPTSVVQPGEFATARNTSGVPDNIRNLYNRLIEGDQLSPNQRRNFRGQAKKLLDAAEMREEQVRKGVTRTADKYKLDIDNILYPPAEEGAPGAATLESLETPGSTTAMTPQTSGTGTRQRGPRPPAGASSPAEINDLIKKYGAP